VRDDELVDRQSSNHLLRYPSLNPFRISGTTLPPNVLLAAKLLALCVIFRGELAALPDHFLPFMPLLQHLGSAAAFHRALQATAAAAAIGVLFNRWVRIASGILGAVFVLAILSSQAYFHNNRLYVGLFFLIVGLYDRRVGTFILRGQLAVIYLGAALNKILDPDWRSGAFVQSWLPHSLPSYPRLTSLLPGMALSLLLGWTGILTEVILIPLLLVRRFLPLGIFLGVTYHTLLLTLTGSTFNMFWYALMAGYIALLQWPSEVLVRYTPSRWLHRLIHRILGRADLEGRIEWLTQQAGTLEAQVNDTTYPGPAALTRIVLYSPMVYFAATVLITLLPHGRALIPPIVLPVLAGIAYGATAKPVVASDARRADRGRALRR
jgi:Vitamin K-dependent gamma-carboxylase